MKGQISETLELAKVAVIGGGGFFATIKLADVATAVSILVGLATLVYVVTKTVYLIKNHGKETSP